MVSELSKGLAYTGLCGRSEVSLIERLWFLLNPVTHLTGGKSCLVPGILYPLFNQSQLDHSKQSMSGLKPREPTQYNGNYEHLGENRVK